MNYETFIEKDIKLENIDMDMTAKNIQKALEYKFDKAYVYTNNVYLYNEESDFLSISKDMYTHEFEIKISRSDFKADFKKSRHIEMKAFYSGIGLITVPGRQTVSCNIDVFIDSWSRFKERKSSGHYRNEEWKDVYPKMREVLCSSEVTYREVKSSNLPNKFSFIVPEGLVSKDEIPEYAGLFYVNSFGSIKEIKRAKFLHKEPFGKWEELCLKFFYRNKYK